MHVAEFYDRYRLIRSVREHKNIKVLKILWKTVILWVYNTILFGFKLFRQDFDHSFPDSIILHFAKHHWWGFVTRNVRMVHTIESIIYLNWCIHLIHLGFITPSLLASACLGIFGHHLSTLKKKLALDHWRGFSNRNTHMVHIVN